MKPKLTSTKRKKIIKELAWGYFSLYIRARDGFQCVICGKRYEDGWVMQAGHVVPRGNHVLTYNEDNVHCQCAACNNVHRYNPQYYFSWFIKKFGEAKFQEFSDPLFLHQVYKIDHGQIMDIYRAKLLETELPGHALEKFQKLEKEYKKL